MLKMRNYEMEKINKQLLNELKNMNKKESIEVE